MNKLENLAIALYGTDEEIMALSTDEALELCGKDREWLKRSKEKMREKLKMALKVKQIEGIMSHENLCSKRIAMD